MNKLLLIAGLTMALGCAGPKNASKNTNASQLGQGDTRTKEVELLSANAYLLTEASTDKTYGFEKTNPVKVGGAKEKSGPDNERRFLNGLLGPNGEEIRFFRAGSCCQFQTPNGLFENIGMLDKYRVYWQGSKDTLDIFINMYDKGDLQIPVGFTARKKQ